MRFHFLASGGMNRLELDYITSTLLDGGLGGAVYEGCKGKDD